MKPFIGKSIEKIYGAKCAALTIFLSGFLVLNSILAGNFFWDNLLWSVFYFSMIFAPWLVCPGRKMLLLAMILGSGFLAVLTMIFVSANPPRAFRMIVLSSGVGMGLLILLECTLATLVIFYSLNQRKNDSTEPVWGCVLAYLLASVVFSDLYWICAQNLPGTFSFNGRVYTPTMENLLYFSISTITTCGFGDIVPVHPLVRQLAGVEAVLGILYVAVFIGRQLKLSPGKKSRREI